MCESIEERWMIVDECPNYEVSTKGNVRSKITGKMLHLQKRKSGYIKVGLWKEGKEYTRDVHRLVAKAFIPGDHTLNINHIDGNKANNSVDNLEWCTPQENVQHAIKNGLLTPKPPEPQRQPIRIIETGEVFDSITACAKAIDSSVINIANAVRDSVPNHHSCKGLHFEYITQEEVEKSKSKLKRTPFLYDYQMEAVMKLKNGNILCGSVGSGKSRSGIYYYFKENGGWIDEYGYVPMKNPQDLYIITTAKKRNSLEFEEELVPFLLSTNPEINRYNNKVVIDSWNNIGKYKDVKNSFFILDEQRLVSYGSWTKTFLKIAKQNNWIMLTATPGDTYLDYLPIFLANGFFKTKTEFTTNHVRYSRFSKYPKIDGYINTRRLDRLRDKIIVHMNYTHQINKHYEDVYCDYDIRTYKDVTKNRWNIFKDEPIGQASELCYVWRRVVGEHQSKQNKLLEILEKHPKALIFYNFDWELEILRNLPYPKGTKIAEYNGHKHQDIPTGEKWVYLCQYNSASEGFNCIRTDTTIFFSQNYSYKMMTQAAGRIDRLNTPYKDLYYYYLKSRAPIDIAISRALKDKKKFNETRFVGNI